MTRPTRIEANCTTGEVKIIELTDEELAQMEADSKAYELEEAKRATKAEADATAKAALLEKLGITADEAKLLLA